jgi:hypothetical protein
MGDPTLRRARAVFGRPSSEAPVYRNGLLDCAVGWRRLGLKAFFTTLGTAPGACNPGKMLDLATITSRKWRTWRGFRVGDSKDGILNDPHTTFHHGLWWLAATFSEIGPAPGDIPTVYAAMRHDRIRETKTPGRRAR